MNFAEECLNLHNHYRTLHSAPPLKLDEKLIAKAEELVLIPRNGGAIFEKYYRPTYNINEFFTNLRNTKAILQAETVVNTWYNTKARHTFSTNYPTNIPARFFTQMVWKSTTHMGIASATTEDGKWWAVAVYYPPGNVRGEYLANVEDLKSVALQAPTTMQPRVRPMTPEQKAKFDKLVAEYEIQRKRYANSKKETAYTKATNFLCCTPSAKKKK